MKYFNLFGCLVLSNILFAYKIPNLKNGIDEVKIKRIENSNECKFINSLFSKKESYNCCNTVTCEEGHITEM